MKKSKEVFQVTKNPKQHHFSRLRIIKNVFVLCVVFFLTFTAYDCLSMLQSTMNNEQGIGVVCQAVTYACFCVSSLLLPKYIIKKLGCKMTLVICMLCYLPYIASNMYPHWSFMLPATILSGFAAALLWGAQCQYLNELAALYASEMSETTNLKIKDFNSFTEEKRDNNVTFEKKHQTLNNEAMSHSNQSSGKVQNENKNVNSGEIKKIQNMATTDVPGSSSDEKEKNIIMNKNLNIYSTEDIYMSQESRNFQPNVSQKSDSAVIPNKNVQSITARFFGIFGMAFLLTHVVSNLMSYFILQKDASSNPNFLNSTCTCGAQFCNEKSDCLVQNLQEPSQAHRNFLTGLCVGLALIAVLLMAIFLDPLNDRKEKVHFSLDFLFATCKHIKKTNQILLTPLFFYIGMLQGFYTGDFTMSFVGCAWGTFHVGLVTVAYGVACTISSPVSGYLLKYIGRPPIIIFSALVNVAYLILLLVWKPTAENPVIFFVAAAMLGTTVGILWSHIKAMNGLLFKNEEEVAFGAYHLWYSLGQSLSFAYSNHLCTYVKIYILLSVLILGITGYLCVEILLRKKNLKK